MALAGFTDGKRLHLDGEPRLMPSLEEYYAGRIPAEELRAHPGGLPHAAALPATTR